MSYLKKPCHDDYPDYPFECYEDEAKKRTVVKTMCPILLHGGAWEDCRFGKEWKEPEIKSEGD